MQQIRPLKIVQFVIDPFQQPVSGAELRNDAVRKALSQIADVAVVSPQSFGVSGKRLSYSKSTPTLLVPDDACMKNFVKYINEEIPDIILLEGVSLLKFGEQILKKGNSFFPNVILDSHNVESALQEELVLGTASASIRKLRALLFGGGLSRAREADARAVQLFNRVLVPTRSDYRRLSNLVGPDLAKAKIRVVENIAPEWALDHLADGGQGAPENGRPVNRLLFAGHLRYRPNVDAVGDLLSGIWPRILSEFPEMHLRIAGRSPKSRIRRWTASGRNVELVADPQFMADIYSACDAVIIPLRSGGGSRLKVLEALAVGKPVIATAKAVEGLDLDEGKHWLRAEAPDDYVRAVALLNESRQCVADLVQNGREIVRRRYGNDAMEASLKSVLSEFRP
ncbi:glycosyltransferase family 4 protein [Hoeflea sp. TYP-13]|uniref:glycosyltransferase family 4 protein n=1 Tax=Hoeflea sp. TYP-13 TaxID=3230023 RepID=UPI0034C6D4EF